jgi:hypothetical protein
MAAQPPPKGPFQVVYRDDTGYEWVANFETQDEATAQAVAEVQGYGGTPSQEVLDDTGATVVTHEQIVAAAEPA